MGFRQPRPVPLGVDEQILTRTSGASLQTRLGVPGNLYGTTKRLIFVYHGGGRAFGGYDWSIKLSDVTGVGPSEPKGNPINRLACYYFRVDYERGSFTFAASPKWSGESFERWLTEALGIRQIGWPPPRLDG